MDVSRLFSLVFVCVTCVLVSHQVQTMPDVTSAAPNGESPKCTTGRSLPGSCVHRAQCDYNTTNIDLTMYAPGGYTSNCPYGQVCCPLQYVLPAGSNSPEEIDSGSDEIS